jgi:hydroxymethylpyrimidine/phosphomethylpyrimidine kinase
MADESRAEKVAVAEGQSAPPAVLTIAGFDPSAGAGIGADLKVFAAHRLYGVAAITAMTVQSTQRVKRVEAVDPVLLRDSLQCLLEDIPVVGVKIGMLATRRNVEVVAEELRRWKIPRARVVLDPVLRSSSGRGLLDAGGLEAIQGQLLQEVGWVTPNTEELGILGHCETCGLTAVSEGARRLAEAVAKLGNAELNVVVTGGHLQRPDDFLRTSGGVDHWFAGERIATRATHGTGCTFSSALLCRLVAGDAAEVAVCGAKAYVRAAMEAAYPMGKGQGPLHHLYQLRGGQR